MHTPEPPSAPLAVGPLAALRHQLSAGAAHYALLLVKASSPTRAPHQLLYFGAPGHASALLAQVPVAAQGLGACFVPGLLPTAPGTHHPALAALLADPRPLVITTSPAAEIAFLLTSLGQQVAAGQGLELTRAYLHALLLRCASLRGPAPATAVSGSLLARFRQLLEQRFRTCKSVTSYAHELCVTPNHLSERIRQETGRPASEHIRQRVMQEARSLLAGPGVQLKQVAYELGFEDTAHFGKLFKRCHGMSFSDFRAQCVG